ncbi:Solute Carrier Family 25 Member 53 [Manis pentadactyla]|nr:Solute Carrier Family 25 Member 53 [Manis pentadactyla]
MAPGKTVHDPGLKLQSRKRKKTYQNASMHSPANERAEHHLIKTFQDFTVKFYNMGSRKYSVAIGQMKEQLVYSFDAENNTEMTSMSLSIIRPDV